VPLPSALSGSILQFGDFHLDCGRFELRCKDRILRLERKPMELLILLASREGQLVTRNEIAEQLWSSGVFVDTEHGINTAIRKLRHLLHDDPDDPRFIQTVTGMGYRFIAPIATVDEVTPEAVKVPAPPAVAKPAETPPPADGKNGKRRLWLALTISGAVIAAILALAIVPTVQVRYQTVLSWLGFRPAIQSVAVLPLANLSNDPEQEYFSDGITEQLITDLSYAKPLRVLSRSSTIGFKGSHLSVPQIAEQLHVDALIEGTVLRVNDTIRVTVRLTAARPERQLWAASYERKVSDAITLQNQLAADAVSQMRGQLTREGQTQLSLESRINPEAYDEYLRGRFFLRQETGQKDKAIPHLERSIQLDPSFAGAYAALGEAWAMDGIYGGGGEGGGKSLREQYAKALESSQRAVNLDPTSSEAYSSLGHSLMQNHRWNQAEVAFRRAIELDPNNPYAAAYLAILLAQKGRNEESLQVSRELALANPVAINFRRVYAMMLYDAHRYDEAIAEGQRLIELDPNHLPTYTAYATSLAQKGRFQEAEDAFHHSPLGRDPGVQAWLYVRQGNVDAARKVLKENASSPINSFTAAAHYLVGEQERGLTELDYLANEAWANKTYFLRVDPLFDPMRNDPRFTAIVKKTGLLEN
jgi:TolB-like protein/Flp pilus assembly protein TadD/DNA-binding winged helix-turn-helix (wHTH) protein